MEKTSVASSKQKTNEQTPERQRNAVPIVGRTVRFPAHAVRLLYGQISVAEGLTNGIQSYLLLITGRGLKTIKELWKLEI